MIDGQWNWEFEPLPILFTDSDNYYPGDGHHRILAAMQVRNDIFALVRQGTLRDAIFYSCQANRFHGLARSRADKRNQVELIITDLEWQIMSDRAIAEHCGVSAPFVGNIRHELVETGAVNAATQRTDRKGRVIETDNIGKKPRAVIESELNREFSIIDLPEISSVSAVAENESLAPIIEAVEVVDSQLSNASLLAQIDSIDIVHFAVHGGAQGLILKWSNDSYVGHRVPIDFLSSSEIRAIEEFKGKLIVSGACESAQFADDFLAVSSEAVVAPLTEIPWAKMGLFFKTFYLSYRLSKSAQDALNQAIKEFPQYSCYRVFKS